MHAAEFDQRTERVGEWTIRITSYRLGERWYAAADNVDPGANVARSQGATRAEAEAEALRVATERVARTRVVG